MRYSLCSLAGAIALAVFVLEPNAAAADFDGDSVPDDTDNCTTAFNPLQSDTDFDGFGNRCDADFNQDGIVNFADLALLRQRFFQSDALTDLSGDGITNFADLALLRASFFAPPGPKCMACPIDPCEEGRALLCPSLSVAAADAKLEQCLATTDPARRPQQFQTATFLHGFTHVVLPAFDPRPGPDPARTDSLSEALDALGVGATGRDPFDFTATLPLLPDGSCTIPEGVHEAEVEHALLAELLPRLDAAISALPSVGSGWVDHCDVSHFGRTERIEIDGSDALLLRAHLHALRAALHLLQVDDLDFDLGDLCTAFREGPLPTIESFLQDHPTFGTRRDRPAAAEHDLRAALDLMSDALDSIRAEADPQSDDLAFIDANDPNGLTPEREAALRARIDYARAALDAPILIPPDLLPGILDQMCGDPTLFLGAAFGAGWEVRALLPPFSGNDPTVDALPDPTVGGLFPGQVAGDLRCALDEEGPSISITPATTWGNPEIRTSEPVHLTIQIRDHPVGSSPGSALDPTTLGVWIATYPYDFSSYGASCHPTLNGVAFPEQGYPGSDVTALLQMTPSQDALELEGDLEVTTTSPTQGCDLAVFAAAADAYGNGGYGHGAVRILERGPVVRFSPRSHYGAPPVALTIGVSAPFGDVILGGVGIRAYAGNGCWNVRINGQPPSFPGPWTAADVTSLLTVADDPTTGERTWSGLVTADAWALGCSLSFQPFSPFSAYVFESAQFWMTP